MTDEYVITVTLTADAPSGKKLQAFDLCCCADDYDSLDEFAGAIKHVLTRTAYGFGQPIK